jgi:hypothetical protein
MRNPILILILFFAIIFGANAQKTRFGILAGPAIISSTRENINKNNDQNDHTRSVHSVTSYFVGVVASVPVSKNIIFRPQLEYIQKGWKNHFDYTDNSQDHDVRIKANCIDVPLNFVYDAPTKSGRFFIGTGPYLSYCLSGNVHNELDATTTDLVFNSSDTTGFSANRIDVGINVIAGYEFRGGFFLSLNYSHGFVDFRTELKNTANPHNKNTVLGLSLGYMFK